MIQIGWEAFVGFCTFVVVIGPGFYWIGRLSRQVETNTSNIKVVFKKLDEIHHFVKNGR